jgi:hypothetical protein
MKLTEYASVIENDKLLKCEMKARDFKTELRFPPYEFLRNSTGPAVLDNDCILR